MPRVCTVCTNGHVEAINNALLVGDPYRHIATRFDTSTGALQRHKRVHMPVALTLAREADQIAHGDDLLGQLRELQGKAMDILSQAERVGDNRSALGAIRETRAIIELLAKIAIEIADRAEHARSRDEPVMTESQKVIASLSREELIALAGNRLKP